MAITVGVVSLGCSKNRVDTELMLALLRDNGYEIITEEARAEVLIVNTCGFIDPAKQESIDEILRLSRFKREGACRCLVVTGCLAQRYESDLMRDMPEIDLLMGVSRYAELPDALARVMAGADSNTVINSPRIRESLCGEPRGVLSGARVLTTPPFSAYVRVADGCDNRCAYCAIPSIRGPYRSRPMDEVLDEMRDLARAGVLEQTLVAQDTSRYGIDIAGRSLLPDLIRAAGAISGIRFLRALYCYPDETDAALLQAMLETKPACRYLDLPLQHADAALLRKMNRRGDPERTRAMLRDARAAGFTLRTTFIVGFPSETDAQFERLMDFTREIAFDRMGAFAFSSEEGTPAAEMPDPVPEDVAQRRLDRLMRLQATISLRRNRERVGETCDVLVVAGGAADGRADAATGAGVAFGRSEREAPETDGRVYLRGAENLRAGDVVPVRITRADTYDLWGDCV